jgi:hypothetical protein
VKNAWKIRRELARLGGKLIAAPGYFLRWLGATAYHDRVLARQRRTQDGALAAGRRIAVYLIFPQGGLLASHLRAIRHLAASGYSPLVVSNCRLPDTDRQIVLRESFRLIERANYGYDFGGYRDGVLSIADRIAGLDRLILVNDSCWFPLPGTESWIAQSEALGRDFAAALWTGAVRRAPPSGFRDIRWQVDKSRRNFHYASFALNIAGPILRDPGFLKFWTGYRLSQDKNRTVRRGEIGLTHWVMSAGYSHGATHELDDLGVRLAALSDADFWGLFGRSIIFDDAELDAVAEDLHRTAPTDRALHEKLLLTAVSRRGAAYVLADYLVRSERFGFLKKSPARQPGQAAAILAGLARDLGETGAEILAEMRRAD